MTSILQVCSFKEKGQHLDSNTTVQKDVTETESKETTETKSTESSEDTNAEPEKTKPKKNGKGKKTQATTVQKNKKILSRLTL